MRETDNWPLSYLAREAARNVLALGARLFPLLLIAVLLGSGAVGLAVKETRDYEARIATLTAQGRNVLDLVYVPDDLHEFRPHVGLRRDSCEELDGLSGVRLAGLLIDGTERVQLAQLGSVAQVRSISATLIPELQEFDLVIGAAAAEAVGMPTAGAEMAEIETVLTSPGGAVLSAVVVPDLGPEVDSTLGAFQVAGPEVQHSFVCRVVLTSAAEIDQMTALLPASIGVQDGDVRATTQFTEQIDVRQDFLHRIERFAPLAAGVFGGIIIAILTYMRSSELAAYRLSGTSPRSLGVMLSFETALIAGAYFTSASLAVLTLHTQLISPLATLLWVGAGAGIWMAVTWILTLPVLYRKPSDMAKDR